MRDEEYGMYAQNEEYGLMPKIRDEEYGMYAQNEDG